MRKIYLLFFISVYLLTCLTQAKLLVWEITVPNPEYEFTIYMGYSKGTVYATVFPSSNYGTLVGYSATTGEELWTIDPFYSDGFGNINPLTGDIAFFNTSNLRYTNAITGEAIWEGFISYQCTSGFGGDVIVAVDECGSTSYNTIAWNVTTGALLYNISSFSLNSFDYLNGNQDVITVVPFEEWMQFIDPLTAEYYSNLTYSYLDGVSNTFIATAKQGNPLVLCEKNQITLIDVMTLDTIWVVTIPSGQCVSSSYENLAVPSYNNEYVAFALEQPRAMIALRLSDGSMVMNVVSDLPSNTKNCPCYSPYYYPLVCGDMIVGVEALKYIPYTNSISYYLLRSVSAYSVSSGTLINQFSFGAAVNWTLPAAPTCDTNGVVYLYTYDYAKSNQSPAFIWALNMTSSNISDDERYLF